MKITLEWLEGEEACDDGIEYYKTLGVEDFFEVLGCCVREGKESYVGWLLDVLDINTLEKGDVLKFCEKYGDTYADVCVELVLKFSQGVSYKEYYVGLLNTLGVEGVKDLTLEEVSSTGRKYWGRLYFDAYFGGAEECVYAALGRLSGDSGDFRALGDWLNRLSERSEDERLSYKSQLDFLLKDLRV